MDYCVRLYLSRRKQLSSITPALLAEGVRERLSQPRHNSSKENIEQDGSMLTNPRNSHRDNLEFNPERTSILDEKGNLTSDTEKNVEEDNNAITWDSTSGEGNTDERGISRLEEQITTIERPNTDNDTEAEATRHLEGSDGDDQVAFKRKQTIADANKDAIDIENLPRTKLDFSIIRNLQGDQEESSEGPSMDALIVCRVQHSIGLAFQALGAYNYALEHFMNSLELHPDHVPSRYHAALMFHALGDNSRAEEELTYIMRTYTANSEPAVLEARGLARQALGRHREALEDFYKCIRDNEGEPHYHIAVSLLSLPEPDTDAVMAELKSARKKGWKKGQVYDKAATAYLLEGNTPSAIKAYSTALKLDPKNISYLCRRSQCYRELGDAATAEKDLTYAIDLAAYEKLAKIKTEFQPTRAESRMPLDELVNTKMASITEDEKVPYVPSSIFYLRGLAWYDQVRNGTKHVDNV